MMTYIMTQLIFFISMLFISTNHPLFLSFLLMLTSVFFSISIYIFSNTSWIPYILVMVFLSGMMIMIIYMTSLSSNEPLMISKKSLIFMVISNIMIFFMSIFTKSFNNSNLGTLNSLINSTNLHSTELIYKTYSIMNWKMTSILIIYLFIVLIAAVKITSLNSGPLRAKK